MWVKKLFISLGIIAGILVASALCLFIYMQQGLYMPSTSDAELIEHLFSSDEPGFSSVEILSSEGEGKRRIPRRLEILVQMESYPQTVSCQGEIFLAMGDPMILNVRWRTLQCAGQHRYIELARIALDNGFDYSKCHDEKITLLLARWVKAGMIGMDDVIFPAVKDAVTPLIANPDLLKLQEAQDAGLFDTSQIRLREDVQSEDGAGQRSSIVLRCDGSVELFRVDPGLIHSYTDIPPGDYLMPETLEPFNFAPVE
jgi:hypothetical protein